MQKNIVETVSLRENFESKILSFKPDVFINCAWSCASSFADIQDIKQFENIEKGIKLFKVLGKLEKLYFVGLGSFSEYGDKVEPIAEDELENPSSLYGLTKKTFKLISEHLCEIKSFPWLWVRPCYVFGPNDVSTRLVPKVINHCLDGETITLDSCESIVDYLYVDDFTYALESLILQDKQGVYNICSGKQYKIKDVIREIEKL